MLPVFNMESQTDLITALGETRADKGNLYSEYTQTLASKGQCATINI